MIEDDLTIRLILRTTLARLFPASKIYTASDGLEGLGLVYVTNPDLIIVDSTLPKYSGVEIVEFLKTNKRIIENNVPIIVLHDRNETLDLPQNFFQLIKSKPDFMASLKNTVELKFGTAAIRTGPRERFLRYFSRKTIILANSGDILSNYFFDSKNLLERIFSRILWFILQVLESVFFAGVYTFGGEPKEENVELMKQDYKVFRVRVMPVIIPSILGLMVFVFQLAAFVTGGLIIFGTRTTSIFADRSSVVSVDLLNSDFDSSKIQADASGVELQPIISEVPGRSPSPNTSTTPIQTQQPTPQPEQIKQPPVDQQTTDNTQPQSSDPENAAPQPDQMPVSSEVLGISTEKAIADADAPAQPATQQVTTYPTDHPSISFKENIEFTKLVSIIERSSNNTQDSYSIPDVNASDPLRQPETIDQVKTRPIPANSITYQLSPNGNDWYYYSGEETWEKTDRGYESSNTIQEVNQYLDKYPTEVGTNDLYIKAFLNSDGNTQIILSDITVNRELDVVTPLNPQPAPKQNTNDESILLNPLSYPASYSESESVISYPSDNSENIPSSYPDSYSANPTTPESYVVPTEKIQPEIQPSIMPQSYPASFAVVEEPLKASTIPAPTLLEASFADGNKVVVGRIDKVIIPDDQLQNYAVNVYYTSSTDITQNASDKLLLIGSAGLHKVTVNGGTQYVFEMIAPSIEGGYVTAELQYVTYFTSTLNSGKSESYTITSGLSKPLKNSTFTVTNTTDLGDSSPGDGTCSTGVIGQCSLRAAIEEANSLAGSDNIYFNIPTTDPGYVDFDTPNIPNSGDGIGGDDYWSIRPATDLPTIVTTVNLDGSTQDLNQGNKNTFGPDIEIDGVNDATNPNAGIKVGVGSLNSTINGLVVNNFDNNTTSAGFSLNGDSGTTLTSNYVGTDIKGTGSVPNYYGVYLGTSNNVNIGTSTSTGNVVSGNGYHGIYSQCGTTGTAMLVNIKGNKVGVNALADGPLYNGTATPYSDASAIKADNQCDLRVGGTATERNYLSEAQNDYYGGGLYFKPDATGLSNLEVFNNFINAKADGSIIDDPANDNSFGIYIGGSDFSGLQNTFKIGAPGQGNLIYSDGDISDTPDRSIDVENNTIAGGAYYGIFMHEGNVNQAIIRNNYVAAKTTGDPYFGVSYDLSNAYSSGGSNYGIWTRSGQSIVQGNYIQGFEMGSFYDQTGDWSRDGATNWIVNKSIIGGQNPLAGSLCQGLEANCYKDNFNSVPTNNWTWGESGGILSYDSVFQNETTIYADNKFLGGNGLNGQHNINAVWSGMVELFSGTVRRTDLADGSLITNLPSGTIGTDFGYIGHLENIAANCSNPADCPASGATSGVAGKSEFLNNSPAFWGAPNMNNQYSWEGMLQYYYDNNGNKINTANWKFDQPHIASQNFSFDGDSTTDPVSSDRAQVWTNYPSANRDPNSLTGLGKFEVMEAEYVDANPVWDGSKYVITVDSTSDEDNVSLAGYNDGAGAYSGGGVNGPNGLANGKTSLREAIKVANAFAQPVTIAFNIPTTDSGYNSLTDTWTITSASALPAITSIHGVTIDGSTQTGILPMPQYGGKIIISPGANALTSSGTIGDITINRITMSMTGATNSVLLTSNGKISLTNDEFKRNVFGGAYAIFISNPGVQDTNFINNEITNFNRGLTGGGASSKFTVTNNVLTNSGQSIGFNISGANGTSISGNTFNSTSSDQGIISTCNSGTCTISNNIMNMPNSGCFASVIIDGSALTNMFGNTINSGDEELVRVRGTGSANIYNNTLNGFDSITLCGSNFGTIVERSGATTGFLNIHNNVITAVDGFAIDLGLAGANFRATVKDNIVATSSSTATPIVIGGGVQDSFGVIANDSGDSDTGINDLMNWPVINSVTYIGGGQYLLAGNLDNSVSGEAPFDIEVCVSDNNASGHGGCTIPLGHTTALPGGNWTKTVTIAGDDGTQNRVFTTLATNNLGSTSEFGSNFVTTSNPNYSIQPYPVTLVSPSGSIYDTQPLFTWDPSGDPDLNHYELYLDGVKIVNVPGNTTQYQYTGSPLSLGNHTWNIIDIGNDNSQRGTSTVFSFDVLQPPVVPPPTPQPIPQPTIIPSSYPGSYTVTPVASTTSYSVVPPAPGPVPQPEIFETVVTPQPTEPPTGLLVSALTLDLLLEIIMIAFALLSLGVSLGFLFGVLFTKKKKYWGIVYDAKTEKTIALAQIFVESHTSSKKYSTLSDFDGRYGILVDEGGEYLLTCKANGYTPYYYYFRLNDSSEDVVIDIPMNPINAKVSLLETFKKFRRALIIAANVISLIILFAGFIYSAIVTIQYPVALNFFILAVYLITFFVNLYLYIRFFFKISSGKVLNKETLEGVSGAAVRFYDNEGQKEVVLTNRNGKIRTRLGNSIYKVKVSKKGFEHINMQDQTLDQVDVNVKNGYMSRELLMKKKEGAAETSGVETPFGST